MTEPSYVSSPSPLVYQGLSLWIVPPDQSPVTLSLRKLITACSEQQSSPNFHPHITLANLPQCVPLEEITACLTATPKPVAVNFQSIRTGQTYFQSVFLAIQATQEILDLHRHVHDTLGLQPKTPEFPHLSLYYGNGNKEELARTVKESLVVGDDAVLIDDNRSGFLAEEIWIVNCEGKPESWTILGKI